MADAQRVLAEQDVARQQAAQELDKSARASKKCTRFPQGHSLDLQYQEDHAEKLAERRAGKKQRKGKGKGKAVDSARQQVEATNAQTYVRDPGPSRQVETIALRELDE